MIEFHILGSTALRKEDGDFDHSFLAGSKRLALLTYLALAGPRGFQRRDKLVVLFWPEVGQKSARNALSNMLYHIREALGKYVLLSRGNEEIRLDPEKMWCDAVAFEEALDDGEVRKALDLYRGDLLPAFHVTDISNEFMSWLDGERERLRKRAAEGAWLLAGKAAQENNRPSARHWAQKAVAYSEFSEGTYRKLITLLHGIGDRSGALKAYEEFAALIREEWKMEPTIKLKKLVENINESDPQKLKEDTISGIEEQDSVLPVRELHGDEAENTELQAETDESAKQVAEPIPRVSLNRWWWAGGIAFLLIAVIASGLSWSEGPGDTAAVMERSVAVLPFTYLGTEDSTNYFSLGMTEEILSRLAQVSDLSVISRTSVMQYQDTEKSLREIAEELGVTVIVEGSVQQVGGRVRIHAQLIDAETDHHLWSESYDRELKNIFAVQSDIAKSIASELKAELAPGVEERIERVPTKNFVAYELYQRGRQHYNRSAKEAIVTAIALYRQAIKRDPDFALAHAALAEAYAKNVWNFGANTQWSDSAVAEARRAISLEPDLGDAYAALGFARMSAGRFSEAGASYEQALDLNPSDWGVFLDIANVHLHTGRIALAIQNYKRGLKVDPARAHGYRYNIALAYRILGLYDRAEQENRASLALEPGFVFPIANQTFVDLFQGDTTAATKAAEALANENKSDPHSLLSASWIFILAGQTQRARDPLERAYALSPAASGEGHVRVRLGYTLWQIGERERATKLFEEFERYASEQIEKGNERAVLSYSLAAVHAFRSQTEQALQWMDRAIEAGWSWEQTTVNDPMLASLRDEARFQVLVERMRERNEKNRRQFAKDEGLEPKELLHPKSINEK